MHIQRRCPWVVLGVLALACGGDPGATGTTEGGSEGAATGPVTATSQPTSDGSASGSTAASVSATGSGSAGSSGAETTGIKFDVNAVIDVGDTGPMVDECKVADNMDAVGECEESAPPDSFEPAVQWVFGQDENSWVTPLVGNFTDDDQNGEIDLCDIPDVLLVANTSVGYSTKCYIHVIDGATGLENFNIPPTENVSCTATPAFGDIDGDGLPEIVAIWNDGNVYRVKAFEHDGSVKWTNVTDGGNASQFQRESGAVALHDLDADGDVEIVFNHEVYDHEGALLWEVTNPLPGELEASTAADLDGDGMLEVITGHSAYRYDGTVYYEHYPTITAQSIPQVANLDDDPEPEIFVTSGQGLWMIEHDGTIKYGPVTPTGVPTAGYLVWQRPGTVHDFDGDGISEWASSSREYYAVYEGPDMTDVLWQAVVKDNSGAAGGTAFDFLGDGVAEAMYADEDYLRVYDGLTGAVLLQQTRNSPTISEYPTVADIDNDGSAEILVVSHGGGEPALQAIRDVEDRWIQARRIWNQHAYYVTNVREDSTIPQFPVDSWKALNTYRTNAQIEGGGLCKPEPPG